MKKNYFWIDFIKSLGAFAVIILHVCVPILYHFNDRENWFVGNFYNSLVRFCVPIFVMTSGVLLLQKTEDLNVFLRKRFSRLLFPFLFWSIIYLLIHINYNLSPKEILSFSIKNLKSGTEFHLWYIYMLIGLYLLIPILSKWSVKATKKELIYFIAIWSFVILLNLPILNKLYTRIDLSYFTGYIGYLVLGFFIFRFIHKKHRWIGFLVFSIGFLSTLILTYYLSEKAQSFSGEYYSFLSANVVAMSIGIFLLFKDITIKNGMIERIIIFMSKHSYGIYLSHVLVLIFFSKIGFNYLSFNAWFSIPVIAVSCLLLSLFVTLLLSKIPFIGKYISG